MAQTRDGLTVLQGRLTAGHTHATATGHSTRIILAVRIDNREKNPGWQKNSRGGRHFNELTHGGHADFTAECRQGCVI